MLHPTPEVDQHSKVLSSCHSYGMTITPWSAGQPLKWGFIISQAKSRKIMIIHYVLSINMSVKLIISDELRYKIEPRYKIKV